MNGASGRGWWLLVGGAAILFGAEMLLCFLGAMGYGVAQRNESIYRSTHVRCLAEGDIPRALEYEQLADAEGRAMSICQLFIIPCLCNLAVFVVAILAKRVSSRQSVIRTASLVVWSMSLGFLVSVVALVALYAAVLSFLFSWGD